MADKFTYLGSTSSRVVHIDDEVNARIAKASAAFGRLFYSVWERRTIRLDTKLKVYNAAVLPTLLYACETWTVYQRHARRLSHFRTSYLRKLFKDLVARQDSRHRSPKKGRDAVCTYSSETGTVRTDRPCYQDAWGTFAKEYPPWRTRNEQTLPWWSEKAIQRHP